MQRVIRDRILEGKTGRQVMWRGAGGSYLFHAEDRYQEAWQLHLPEIQKMGLNTVRHAFKFSWDTLSDAGADVLDLSKMDWIVAWLASHGVKSILDYHGSQAQMFKKPGYDGSTGIADVGDPVNPQLIQSWEQLAAHYKDNHDVVAYEIYNEPSRSWGGTYRSTARRNAEGYRLLTDSIRRIDPDHICIWQTPSHYIAPFSEIDDLMMPNVVYTAHRWWTRRTWEFNVWTPEQISYITFDALVKWRKDYKIPIWLGEFGLGGGGNAVWDPTNPHNQVCEQLLFKCEEQVVGWNLWQGKTAISKPWHSAEMFPLKVYNEHLIRRPFFMSIPNLIDYVTDQQGVDRLEPYQISLWHNKDFVTLNPGVKIRYELNTKHPDGTVEIVETYELDVTNPTTFLLEEGGELGDRNINIYSLSYIPIKGPLDIWTFPAVNRGSTLYPPLHKIAYDIAYNIEQRMRKLK